MRRDTMAAGEDHLALSALTKKQQKGVTGEEANLFLNRLDMWGPQGHSLTKSSPVATTARHYPPPKFLLFSASFYLFFLPSLPKAERRETLRHLLA